VGANDPEHWNVEIGMTTRVLGRLGILSAAILIAACDVKVGQNGVSVDIAHGSATDQWSRTYHLSPGGRIDIVNIRGQIVAQPSPGADVEVTARREARAGNEEAAKAVLAAAQMVEQVSADHVSIESRTPNTGRGRDVNVQITVLVPPGLKVSLKTEQGGVRLEGVEGHVVAHSTNGPIVARALSGSADVSTVNGSVRVEFEKLTADSRLSTVNGPVDLAIPPDVNATLEASVINGAVVVADDVALTATEKSGQRVVGRINNGGTSIVAQATNGRVRIGAGRLDTSGGRRGRGRRGGQP
jgi:Toastrack DUF4097